MGLFDFASNMGKKLFGNDDKDEDASKKLKEEIEKNNPGVENLDVKVENGVASIKGDAKSPDALEKAILMAGNTMGVQEVKADEATVTGQSKPQLSSDEEFYVIESGDSLWKIAERAYGDGSKYTAVFEANREVIEDPDKIYPGQKIRLPKNL